VSAGPYDATAHTPPPGGLTGAPFTAPVPGVPAPGRGKVIVAAALAGLLVAGGGTVFAVNKMRGRQQQAIGITPPPIASGAEPPPVASSAEKVAEPTPTPEPKVEPKVEPKAGAGAKVPTTPVGKLPTVKPVVSTTPAKEAPSAAASTAKKPPPPPPGGGTRPKDDPGY
jgi:hypothetical protein